MPTKIQAKQVARLLYAAVNITGFAFPAAASVTVTTALTTALSTAGDGGVSVPVQVASAVQQGAVTAATDNVVDIWVSATKMPLADAAGNEVYGRLTEAAGVYTLALFSLVAGVETSVTPAAQNIDFQFSYNFDFDKLPITALVSASTKHVGDDPAGSGTKLRAQTLTPTGLNTFPALGVAYNSGASGGIFELRVNGQDLVPADGFAVAGTTVTWTAATTGFDVTTTDKVYALYSV
jgi:hypothetical protein